MFWLKKTVLSTLGAIIRVTSRFMLAYICLFGLAFGLTFYKDVVRYPALNWFIEFEEALRAPGMSLLQKYVPTNINGIEMAPWIFLAIVFVTWIALVLYLERLFYQGMHLKRKKEIHDINRAIEKDKKEELARQEKEAERRARADALARAQQEAMIEAHRQTLERAQAESEARAKQEALAKADAEGRRMAQEARGPKPQPARTNGKSNGKSKVPQPKGQSREELLEILAQAKKSLDEHKRVVAFLSMDVMDSTGMKAGEEPAIAARDFGKYKLLVEDAIKANNYLKAAWTPDGVMICFGSAADAIKAGQQLINGLEDFNKNVKALRQDFRVRAGVNAGKVLFDDAVPMEEMSDRVIDIAGHMQKYAEGDSIYINAAVLPQGMPGFQPVSKDIDGCKVTCWRAKTGAELPA